MKESLNALCERFAESIEILYKQKGFKLTSTKIMPICAYIYATSGEPLDPDYLQECVKLVEKRGGGIFSGLRDAMQKPLACALAVSGNAGDMMDTAAANFDLLKKTYQESKYLGTAAILLPRMGAPEEIDSKIARGKVIYDCLKNRHKINTDYHDTLMTNLIAYSEKPVEVIADEIEQSYVELKKITNGEYSQTCALILTCSDKPAEEKCARFKEIYEALQADKKTKYSNGSEIVILAALSLLDTDVSTLVRDISETSDCLSETKHYKGLLATFGKYTRMMHAAMLVLADNASPELNALAAAAVFLSGFYAYEIEEASSAAVTAATIP